MTSLIAAGMGVAIWPSALSPASRSLVMLWTKLVSASPVASMHAVLGCVVSRLCLRGDVTYIFD
jgi:hypothetical protein